MPTRQKKNDVVKIANTSNSLAKRDLNLKIPPRIMTKEEKEKNKIQTNTPFEFSIQRGDQSSSNDDEANKIALIRGFGRVSVKGESLFPNPAAKTMAFIILKSYDLAMILFLAE